MTRAAVTAMIHHASGLLSNGDCFGAQQALGQAWTALGAYSAGLAARGASTATAISLHKSITKVQNAIGRQCATMAPTGQSAGRNPDLLPPSGRSSGGNPDLMPPSFGGTGDDLFSGLTTTLTFLGVGAAMFGVGYGFWIIYKGSEA